MSTAPPAPAPLPPVARTTSNDLGDLLSQIGEGDLDVPVDDDLTDPRDVSRPERPVVAVIVPTGGIDFVPSPASFVSRFVGLAVDTVATTLFMTPGLAMLLRAGGIVRVLGVVVALAGFVAATVLYARSVNRRGRWIGNTVTSTRVVNVVNGAFPSVPEAATRFVVRSTISPVFLFGFLVALGHPQRRAFHDQIADTVVTGRSRQAWSVGDPTD